MKKFNLLTFLFLTSFFTSTLFAQVPQSVLSVVPEITGSSASHIDVFIDFQVDLNAISQFHNQDITFEIIPGLDLTEDPNPTSGIGFQVMTNLNTADPIKYDYLDDDDDIDEEDLIELMDTLLWNYKFCVPDLVQITELSNGNICIKIQDIAEYLTICNQTTDPPETTHSHRVVYVDNEVGLTPGEKTCIEQTVFLTEATNCYNTVSVSGFSLYSLMRSDISYDFSSYDFNIMCPSDLDLNKTDISLINPTNCEVYPTLFDNQISVKHSSDQILQLAAYNIFGQLIHTVPLETNNMSLNTSDWNPGYYILQLLDKNKHSVFQQKVMKL